MIGLLIGPLVSQGLWAKTYGGTSYDGALSLVQTGDGGYAVAGYTWSASPSQDFLVIKINSDGTLSWANAYSGPGAENEAAYSIVQTTDNGYAVAGWTASFGAGRRDFLILKINSSGSLSWAKTFGGPDDDIAHSIVRTADGGYAVAGCTFQMSNYNYALRVLKLNSDGTLSWARTFGGGTGDDHPWSIIQTTDGGFVVAGYTTSFGAGGHDVIVLKLASNGTLSWARTFGGTDWEDALSVIQTIDGGYLVAGYTWSFGAGNADMLFLRLASDGTLLWARTFGGTGNETASSVVQTTDGSYVAVGGFCYEGDEYYDFLVLKLSSDGTLEWARRLGEYYEDRAYSVAPTSDGGCVVAGYTESLDPTGYSQVLVLKLGPDGNYPGCVRELSLIPMDVNPSTFSPSGITVYSPSTSSPSPTPRWPGMSITDICLPVAYEEPGGSLYLSGVTCSPAPGAALFLSREEMPLSIYASDGRLVYHGNLMKGENRIPLETGVYLWCAGSYKGKAVVR
ncbi:MAG: hypothetical protein ABIN66_09115 [candidate division WOR-3 bacterium]